MYTVYAGIKNKGSPVIFSKMNYLRALTETGIHMQYSMYINSI